VQNKFKPWVKQATHQYWCFWCFENFLKTINLGLQDFHVWFSPRSTKLKEQQTIDFHFVIENTTHCLNNIISLTSCYTSYSMTIIQGSIRTLTLFNKNHKKKNQLLWENCLGKILIEEIWLHKKTRTWKLSMLYNFYSFTYLLIP
jgi:hypothetical protein